MSAARLGRLAFVVLFLGSMPLSVVFAGDAARAKRDLAFAKDNAESGRFDNLEDSMKRVEKDMEGLSDAEKAPLLPLIAEIKAIVTKNIEEDVTKRLDKVKEAGAANDKLDLDRALMRLNSDEAKAYADPAVIAKLRDRHASLSGSPAPTTPTPTTPTPTTPNANTPQKPMSDDLAYATSKVHSAHSIFDGGDPGIAQTMLRDALKVLANVPQAEKGPLLADIAALSKQIDEVEFKARRAEEFRRVDSQMHRYVTDAQNSIENGVVCYPARINKAAELLASNDVQLNMDAAHLKAYQSQIDELRVKLREHNITTAIARSADVLKELEEKVASDPFKGTDQISAYNVFSGIHTLAMRVRAEFNIVAKDDPRVTAVLQRVAAAEAKVEAASGKWATEKMQEQFAQGWKFAKDSFAGWETETPATGEQNKRRLEGLNKTTQAIRGTVYWLNSADTKQTLATHKDNAVVAATVAEAQKTLDAASAKLNDAFNAVIAQAERDPMPTRESDRAEIKYLGHNAENWFAGTKYKEPNAARALALDAKWTADVARMEKEMDETLKKLTAQADAAWPAIEASVGADKNFEPADVDRWKGKTIELKGYWNRSGWDYDHHFDFAVGIKGIPVAGNYDPHVLQAFKEGSSHTKFGINDHVGWDLIAVVEGRGQINRRVNTDVIDKQTREVIMKIESYVPEPCVVIKIIGLRAGPVAVGPK